MNNIALLEQHIAAVEQMLAADQAWLDAEPDSIAARMQLGSTRNHLEDLRQQLRRAKAARVMPHFGDAAREGEREPARAGAGA